MVGVARSLTAGGTYDYAGLDIHSKRICASALNETGQLVHRTQVHTLEELLRFLKGLTASEVTTGVVA
jgi:hypothetical protein